MVMDYGMSELGRVNFRNSPSSAFLATGMPDEQYRMHSERTAQQIDEQVNLIIERSIEVVREILTQRHDALEAIAGRLIEVESIVADELKQLVEDNSPSPRVVPGTEKTNEESSKEADVSLEEADRRQDPSIS